MLPPRKSATSYRVLTVAWCVPFVLLLNVNLALREPKVISPDRVTLGPGEFLQPVSSTVALMWIGRSKLAPTCLSALADGVNVKTAAIQTVGMRIRFIISLV